MRSHLVDQLAELASSAEPPPLSDAAARRLIDRALVREAAPVAAPSPWRYLAPAFAAVAIVGLVVLAWPRTSRAVEPPIQITLPTGDRLVGTPGAAFDIGELVPASRVVRLHRGTMLFDVAHVTPDQRFEVAIPGARVIATGTVFSVGVDLTSSSLEPGAARVEVYEGHVEIHHADRPVIERLGPGEVWSSGALIAEPTSIGDAARLAVIARATEPPHTARPVVAPIASSVPAPSPPVIASNTATPATVSTNPARSPVPPVTAPTIAKPGPIAAPEPTTKPSIATPKSPLAKLDDELALAQADLAAARYQAAIDRTTGRSSGAWLLVVADANRGLGHAAAAADAYDRAAQALTGVDRATAGYSAAYLRFRDLKDPAAALASLQSAGVDDKDSPLEERALALSAQLLSALHRDDDARARAERYLERFPRGELITLMRKLARR